MGAGRSELLMHLFGALGHRTAAASMLDSKPLGPGNRPDESIRRGLVLVSEDRKRYGLVLEQSIGFNLSLSSLVAADARRHDRRSGRSETANRELFSLAAREGAVAADAGGDARPVATSRKSCWARR